MVKLEKICEDIAFDECEEVQQAEELLDRNDLLIDRAYRSPSFTAVPVNGYIIIRKRMRDEAIRVTWASERKAFYDDYDEKIVGIFKCKAKRGGKKYLVKVLDKEGVPR